MGENVRKLLVTLPICLVFLACFWVHSIYANSGDDLYAVSVGWQDNPMLPNSIPEIFIQVRDSGITIKDVIINRGALGCSLLGMYSTFPISPSFGETVRLVAGKPGVYKPTVLEITIVSNRGTHTFQTN